MGGCQNSDPFWGYPKYQVLYYNRDQNSDNHLHVFTFARPCEACVPQSAQPEQYSTKLLPLAETRMESLHVNL